MNERVYASIMLAAFLPFVIIFVLLWRYCVGVFSDSILQSATESFRSRQDQLQTLADDYLDLARMIAGDEEMVRLLHGKGNPSFLNYRINQRIHSLIPFQSSLLQGIYFLTSRKGEFVLLFDDGNTHLSLRGIGKEPYRSLFEKAQTSSDFGRYETGFFTLRGMPCVTVSIPVEQDLKEPGPAITLLLEQEVLAQMALLSSENSLPWAFRILAGEGQIGEDPVFPELTDGGEMLEGTIEGIPWKLQCVVNLSRIRRDAIKRFGAMFFLTLIVYILLVVLITGMVKLRSMQTAEKQRVAELKALELEINPHYLYNTLNTINSVAVEHGDYQVSRLLKGYSSTLVYMLHDRSQPVTIRQESDWLKEYLLLQQERFPGMFIYELDVEPEVADLLIYKMLLQPFVENTILHGFEEQKEEGFLSILFYGDDDTIVISIWDNGRGIDAGELEHLRKIAAFPMETESERIGILNTCRRLYGYYGNRYTLKFDSAAGKGTKVELRLPVMQDTVQL